jgi:hypothetical protein
MTMNAQQYRDGLAELEAMESCNIISGRDFSQAFRILREERESTIRRQDRLIRKQRQAKQSHKQVTSSV